MIELEKDLTYDETLPPPQQPKKVRDREREFVTTKLEMISATEARVLEKVFVPGAGQDEIVIDLEKRASRKRRKVAKRVVEKNAKKLQK